MKLRTHLFHFVLGASLLVVFPIIMIFANNYFGLPVIRNSLMRLIGYVLFMCGVSLILYCSFLFLKIGKGTPFPNAPPKKLVVKGIYKYTRNPMFISYVIIFLSLFLILGHFLLLVYFILSIPYVHFHAIFIEEPPLKKRFGKSYVEYTEKVPRWLFRS